MLQPELVALVSRHLDLVTLKMISFACGRLRELINWVMVNNNLAVMFIYFSRFGYFVVKFLLRTFSYHKRRLPGY